MARPIHSSHSFLLSVILLLRLQSFHLGQAWGFHFDQSPSRLPRRSPVDTTNRRHHQRCFRFAPSSSSRLCASTPVSGVDSNSSSNSISSPVPTQKRIPFPIVVWKFTRPHTLIGSALAIPALHGLAARIGAGTGGPINPSLFLASILYSTIPALLMNLYITGLNQITDVEIDKINKPNLPLAAGIMSRGQAIGTALSALVISLYMGVAHPVFGTQGLNVALWGSGILGTIYSLEPFRLKRFPLLAAFCIVAVRGAIINAGFYAHAKAAALGVSNTSVLQCLTSDPACMLSSLFFGIFGIVIALMKDVPDVLGDKISDIRTFSVRVGPQRIFHASRKILSGLFLVTSAAFLKGVVPAISARSVGLSVCRSSLALFGLLAANSIRRKSSSVDPENPSQVYSYYMFLWKLFYLSYLVLPLAR